MGRTKELSMILDDCADVANSLASAAAALAEAAEKSLVTISAVRGLFSAPGDGVIVAGMPEKAEKSPQAGAGQGQPAGEYTKEEVRKFLAGIAKGHRDEVKALLGKYGAETLTQLDPAHYAAIMADAEVIADA